MAVDTEKISKKYRALFDSNMIGIVISDLDEKILEANDVFLSLIGYTKKDLLAGKIQWSTITPRKYDEIDQKKIHELLQHGRIVPFEKEYTHKQKHQVPVLVGAALIHGNPPLSICFALDMTEQKKLEEKKDEFIGTVSHELRTPLAVLKIHTDLFREEIIRNAPAEHLLKSVTEIDLQINQLTVLITDLLNFARLGDHRALFQQKLFDLKKNIEKAVKNTKMISRRNIVFHKSAGNFIINGNQDRIMQVTLNLIMNALQYSSTDTRVIVSITKKNNYAQVCVRDFGIGIAKKNIAHIFERHYRASHANRYAPNGAGIGLHIAQEIIHRHHGRMFVKSVAGEGSSFCYTLPLVSAKRS